jgi:ADP-L-glycero-D-manno-heptose 6-epimerase
VWVKDVVDVNLHFLEHPEIQGIFNVGTGRAQSFNDVATTTLNTIEGITKTTEQWVAENKLRYIDFPKALIGKYQSYTKADLTNLTIAGDFNKNFATVEQGVKQYVTELAAR